MSLSQPVAGQKPAFHQSTLSMVSKCGTMAEFVYVKGMRRPPGVAMIVGTAVHRALDADLGHKIKTGAGLPTPQVEQAADEAVHATWAGESPVLDEEEKAQGVAQVKGDAVDKAVRLASLHSRILTPILHPTHVNRKMRLVLEGFPVDIEGEIDLQEGHRKIIDHKTSGKSPALDEADGNIQLGIYSWMKSAIDGIPAERVGLNYLVDLKSGAKVVQCEAPAPTTFDHLARRVEAAWKVFETGAFYPVDPKGPSGWVCSEKWCGFYASDCPFGKRARTQVAVGGAT